MSGLRHLRSDLPSSYSFSAKRAPVVAKLDQNEAPIDLPPELKRELLEELCSMRWNRYLRVEDYLEAKAGLADTLGLAPECVAITSGGDHGLWLSVIVGGGPGRRVRWFEPTYPFIGHAARLCHSDCDPVELGPDIDSKLNLDHVQSGDLVFLVSPNNPTGGLVEAEIVRAATADPNRLVVVDEAYFDFSRSTVAPMLEDCENLLIVRSLSKSLLASVHVGYVIGSPSTIAMVERVATAPFHLTAHQLLVAKHYGQIRPHVVGVAELVRRERERLSAAFAELAVIESVKPSSANFLLLQLRRDVVRQELASAGVKVRDVSGLPGLDGHIRVTIGTREDNDVLLGAIRSL